MGIKGLTKLLQEKAEGSMKERDIKSYFGRKIAIDASMCLYQFLIAVRSNSVQGQLTNSFGDVTSHIVGFFYRSIRMLENGIKPVYVFDGKPPIFKSGELQKRKEKRDKASKELKEAEKNDDESKQIQMEKRLVKVTKKEVNDIKKLLKLMGIPYVDAPGEAEAQCAYMVKNGLVYATATEDMDALTFGTNKLLRHLTVSAAKKLPILEFDLNKVLNGLNMNMNEFIDLCILCGCDYTDAIKGIGPKKAFDGIKKYKNIENFIKNLDKKKYKFDENLFKFKQARNLFINPDVLTTENDNNNNNNNKINNVSTNDDSKNNNNDNNVNKNNNIDTINNNNNNVSDNTNNNSNNNNVATNKTDNVDDINIKDIKINNENNNNNNNNNNDNNKNETDKENNKDKISNENDKTKENELIFENLDNRSLKLKWGNPETEKLIDYLVTHCNMAKDRVLNGIKRIEKSKKKSSQKRLDSFFKMKPNVISSTKKPKKLTGKKRKNMDKNKKNTKPKGKKMKN